MRSVIEWHDGLPDKSGRYMCVPYRTGKISTLEYSDKYKAFNAMDDYDAEFVSKFSIKVELWAEMPKEIK